MMHHKTHALGVGIFVETCNVEIGIRRHEIENIVLRETLPVLPTDVPALHQNLTEAVLSGKVNVSAHILRVGAVLW